MTLDSFYELAKVFGVPSAMLIIALWAFYTDRIVTRSAYQNMVHEKDRQILREQKQLSDLWDSAVVPSIQVGRGALDKLEATTRSRTR
jgi:hypothetical protein